MHTSRMELADKLLATDAASGQTNNFQSIKKQSEQHRKELLDELANFGDAVMANVDKESAYQAMYKNLSGKIELMTAEESVRSFQSSENILKDEYEQLVATATILPASLQEIVTRQAGELYKV